MKNTFYIILITFILGGCAQTVPLSQHEKLKVEHQKYLALLQLFKLEGNLIFLESLRENNTDAVIESLENGSDISISFLMEYYFDAFDNDPRFNEYFNSKFIKTLQRVKDYRQQHPRVINFSIYSDPPPKSGFDAESMREMSEYKLEVEGILRDLNTLSNQTLKRTE